MAASVVGSAYHFTYSDDNLGERHSATLVRRNSRSYGESQCSYECKEGRAVACDESAREAGDTIWWLFHGALRRRVRRRQ